MNMGLIEYTLGMLIQLYIFAVIIYVFMSWVPGARESRFGEFLEQLVEPYLEVFRKIIPPIGMIDISPIVAIIILNFARQGLRVVFDMFGF